MCDQALISLGSRRQLSHLRDPQPQHAEAGRQAELVRLLYDGAVEDRLPANHHGVQVRIRLRSVLRTEPQTRNSYRMGPPIPGMSQAEIGSGLRASPATGEQTPHRGTSRGGSAGPGAGQAPGGGGATTVDDSFHTGAPQIFGELMGELSALIAAGVLAPSRPTAYELADGTKALTELGARATVGKLALLP
jgi:hypothetical protein